jgi:peptide deformylase
MALLDIKTLGNPVLTTPAEPIRKVNAEIKTLISDMFETMYHTHGVGLAAPQVGISKRLFIIDTGDVKPFALINPVLEKGWDQITESEGCLSIPGVYMPVKRYKKVRFSGRNEKDRAVTIEATGLLARALQHELDHLDGKVFVDLVEDKEMLAEKIKIMEARLASGETVADIVLSSVRDEDDDQEDNN